MWYNGPPEIQITNAPTGVNALTPSAEIKALQDEANRKADEAKKAAEAWNLTPSQLYEDAQEAFVGILGDLLGLSDRHSVKEIMLHGNRLREFGNHLYCAGGGWRPGELDIGCRARDAATASGPPVKKKSR